MWFNVDLKFFFKLKIEKKTLKEIIKWIFDIRSWKIWSHFFISSQKKSEDWIFKELKIFIYIFHFIKKEMVLIVFDGLDSFKNQIKYDQDQNTKDQQTTSAATTRKTVANGRSLLIKNTKECDPESKFMISIRFDLKNLQSKKLNEVIECISTKKKENQTRESSYCQKM